MSISYIYTKSGIPIPVVNKIKLAPNHELEVFLANFFHTKPILKDDILIFIYAPHILLDLFIRNKLHLNNKIIYFISDDLQLNDFSGIFSNNSIVISDGENIDISELIEDNFYGNIKIMDWNPSKVAFKDQYKHKSEYLTKLLKRFFYSILTNKYFQNRWAINSLNNSCKINNSINNISIPSNIILLASGPSLNHNKNISYYLSSHPIISLPSSLCFLNSLDIIPDYIFSTDGGYYANIHLLKYFKALKKRNILYKGTVICPLKSNIKSVNKYNVKTFFYNNFEPFDLLFKKNFELPERGSVAFSCLDFLRFFNVINTNIFGLDLKNYELERHVKPHTFYLDDYIKSSRLSPLKNSISIDRYLLDNNDKSWRDSNLEVYNEWFDSNKHCYNFINDSISATTNNQTCLNYLFEQFDSEANLTFLIIHFENFIYSKASIYNHKLVDKFIKVSSKNNKSAQSNFNYFLKRVIKCMN